MDLDELLKSIRDEGKKESALSPTSSTVNTEDEKLVEEVIDPKVLEILGIDFTGDLTYGEYKTILKEKMAAQRMGGKVDSGDAEKITEEYKRVKGENNEKRFKVKKTKLTSEDIAGKKPESKTDSTRAKVKPLKGLLPSSDKLKLEGKEEEEEKKVKIKKEKKDDPVLKNVIVIKKTVKQIASILKKQGELFKKSGEKSRIAGEKGRKRSREDMLESAKGATGKVIDKIKKPFTSIFDAIKRFLLFTLLGSLLGVLLKIFKNPKKFFLQPIQNIIDAIFGFFNKIIGFIDDTFIGPFRFIIEKVQDGLNFFIDRINDVLSLIPGAPKIDKLELPQIPEIPELNAPDIIGDDDKKEPDVTPPKDGEDGKDGKDGKDAPISPKQNTPQADKVKPEDTKNDTPTPVNKPASPKPQGQSTPPPPSPASAPQGSDTEQSTPVQALSGGGPVNDLMSIKSSGGFARSGRGPSPKKKKSLGTDTVPAMLTPGEFVMSKEAVDKIGLANLMEMNKKGGGTNKPNIISGISFGDGAGTLTNEQVWGRKNLKPVEVKESNKTIDKLKQIEKEKGVRSIDVGSELANKGGEVKKETGVKIEGLGPDTQLTALQPGEVVVTKKAAKALGVENLLKVNEALGGSNKAKKAKLGDVTLSAMSGGGQVKKHPILEKLSDSNIKKVGSAPGMCVTGSLLTMEKSGAGGLGIYTSDDVGNNPRGAIVQMMQSPENWKSIGGSPITLKSPYGTVRAGQYSGSQYDNLVSGGKIPSGALVFQTRHNSWNGTSPGSSGYDMAIAQRGGKEHWNGQPMPQHIYGSVKKVIVLTPDGKQGDGSDAKIAPGEGSDEVAGDTPSTSGQNSPVRSQENKPEIKKVYNADGTLNFNKTFIHEDLMSGGTFGGSFFNKKKKSDSKTPQVDTSKVVPSNRSQFSLDPTQTGASNPAVFKAAQEAREKARAEGLSPEEVEKRVIAASIAAKQGQSPQMSKSPRTNIPQAPAKKTPQVLPLPPMGGGQKQPKMNGGTSSGGGTPPVSFSSLNPSELGRRAAVKSLLGIVG